MCGMLHGSLVHQEAQGLLYALIVELLSEFAESASIIQLVVLLKNSETPNLDMRGNMFR